MPRAFPHSHWETSQRLSSRAGAVRHGGVRAARLFRWEGGRRKVTDGPYAEAAEHFAGFFLVDVASRERAEEVAAAFSGPGETVELRPVAD
jgi:hypothetical protein